MRVSKDGASWIFGYKAISTLIEGSASTFDGKWSMINDSWPLLTFRRYLAYGLERGLVRNLIFLWESRRALDATKPKAKGLQKRLLPENFWTPLVDIVENHPQRQPLYRQRANLGATWCHAKFGLLPRHNVSVVLEPHPKRSTLLPEVAQQNHFAHVLNTLNPYQGQLGSWKLNVRFVHLPIGELLCRKMQPRWRHVHLIESMPITRYIQRYIQRQDKGLSGCKILSIGQVTGFCFDLKLMAFFLHH